MTVILNPIGYKPTKKEQADNNIDNFDQRIDKALGMFQSGYIDRDQVINEIKVAHSNYKHNQKRIYNLEDDE